MYPVQEFFEQFPQESGSIFLFNAYTGEAIYDVDEWGSPLTYARRLAHWFEPTTLVPTGGNHSSPGCIDTSNVSIALK